MFSCVLFLAAWGMPASGATVRLRITVVNPRETNQVADVRANLPARVGTNDVVSWGGLDWGYDTRNDIYYVHKKVELGPKEGRVFDIDIRDIWTIEPGEIDGINRHAGALVDKLRGAEVHATATELQKLIEKNLADILERQDKFAIGPGVEAIQHINAYETNLGMLRRVKRDVGMIENLVLGTGQDIGEMVGESKLLAKPERGEDSEPAEYKTAIMEFTVVNPSVSEKKQAVVRESLPEEVKIYDVLEAGELEVGADYNTGMCYVYKEGIDLAPGEKKTFRVTIRDKWDVNGPRVASLIASASNLLYRVEVRGRYKGVEEAISGVLGGLLEIRGEEGPTAVNDAYVAFFREQTARVDILEQKLRRVEAALRPIERKSKWGFAVQAPSKKTTWLIIYIVLGFLGFFSVLFFLRWYGKSKSEKLGL